MNKLKVKAGNLPESPGVYIMKDSDKNVIYVGKAKILKRRVSQYFMESQKHSDKVKKMVSNIEDFDYIMTDSEFEALVLECSLIKRHKPKYNILLKDGKGYSYIKVTNEKWPRILYVKQKTDEGALYFGPYVNSFYVKNLAGEVINIFKLPTCNRNFSKAKSQPCLNYYINKCAAPCLGNMPAEEYKFLIDEAVSFIKNGSNNTIEYLNKEMLKASENLNFEKAANIRDRIKSIRTVIKDKQKVVSNKIKDQDVIAIAANKQKASVHVFRFENGNLYDTENFVFDFFDDEISLRTEFIKRYYDLKGYVPKNITLDGNIENLDLIKKWLSKIGGKNVKILMPSKGDLFKLVQMCKSNAYEVFKCDSNDNKSYLLEDLKNLLSLDTVPLYIEAYDISNLQGSDNVGGMVVFYNTQPLKSEYKRFKIKSIDHQDDYNSIREVMSRRIKNYKENKISDTGFGKLPDLILVDGGFGQTSAAKEIFAKEEIYVPIFGMVKDGGHRTRAITTHDKEIDISKNQELFSFITRVQDEVHRYTIGYHKMLRNKRVKGSILTNIPGVGKKRASLLLKKFGSIKNISSASAEELLFVEGITKPCAGSIYDYFQSSDNI
ncbi:MAG: excinuclease ABC subunit UvrC [Oscillospiraceae bacterium]|jgi:excinuclease ABC subunit C|nr:excinuclease ABC subunit UvrC [Oscillospiraceae bacterium]